MLGARVEKCNDELVKASAGHEILRLTCAGFALWRAYIDSFTGVRVPEHARGKARLHSRTHTHARTHHTHAHTQTRHLNICKTRSKITVALQVANTCSYCHLFSSLIFSLIFFYQPVFRESRLSVCAALMINAGRHYSHLTTSLGHARLLICQLW